MLGMASVLIALMEYGKMLKVVNIKNLWMGDKNGK